MAETRKGGLTMPKNPAAELQRLIMEEQDTPPSVLTEERTPVLTDTRTDGLTEGHENERARRQDSAIEGAVGHGEAAREQSALARTDGRKDGRTEGREATRTAVRKSVPPQGRQAVRAGGRVASPQVTEETFFEHIRQVIDEKRPIAGGNKTTVDMTPELARRAALYSLDHGKVSTRLMFVELLDAFLTVEGY